MTSFRVDLERSEIPTHWYNIAADLSAPLAAPLGPDGKPLRPEALSPIFPPGVIEQEMSTERWIAIPEEVRELYCLWRPTPLCRAARLEKALGTPCKIYYKNEAVCPVGSHKLNSAIAQAYYNKVAGISRIVTETGAGQWGAALSLSGELLGLAIRIYMVRVSHDQKPGRRSMMRTWGAEVFASPTSLTQAGRAALEKDPNNPGSLGLAISEAVEEAASRPDTNYALGSVLNHVLLHQTVIGLEAKRQFEKIGEYPDMIFAPCGGGSNFGGVAFPFLADAAAGRKVRAVAVEPTSCPSLTKGHWAYDYGDTSGYTPMMLMYTLGHDFMPPSIHAGGLRYHGASPLVSHLYHERLIEAVSVPQLATFEAGIAFARAEGIVPAPESAHAIRATIDEALRCKATGESKVLLFNLSGHGHFDMTSYDRYFENKLEDYSYPEEAIAAALHRLPQIG